MNSFIQRVGTALVLSILLFVGTTVPTAVVSISIALVGLIILVSEWPRLIINRRWWLVTPLYPVLPFVLAIALNQDPLCSPLLLYLIICVCAHDTGAYCVGKLMGRHFLCPSISPQKTWQGLIGGFVAVIGMLSVIETYTTQHMPWYMLLPLAASVSLVATAGDLFESWLKRKAGIKDSGALLPGHGGFLDRCDGMMSCMYLVYPLRDLLMRLF